MKTRRLFVLLLLTIVTISTGCSKQGIDSDYSIEICDFSDSVSDANHNVENDIWSKGSYVDKKAQKNIEITISGKTYQMEYLDSSISAPNNYVEHDYKDADGTYVSISDDGKLCLYSVGKEESLSTSEKIYSEQECIDIAKNFLNTFTSSDDYTIETEYDEEDGQYKITFKKYVSGFLSADTAVFNVKNTGCICSYRSRMLGRIPKDAVITKFDIERMNNELVSKLDTIYSETKKNHDEVVYENTGYILTLDENNNYAMQCYVDVFLRDYSTIDDTYGQIGERLMLLIH